jgi:hypothetical protein
MGKKIIISATKTRKAMTKHRKKFGHCRQWACIRKAVGKHGYCSAHYEFNRVGEKA